MQYKEDLNYQEELKYKDNLNYEDDRKYEDNLKLARQCIIGLKLQIQTNQTKPKLPKNLNKQSLSS